LRSLSELDDIVPRFDPTVVGIPRPGDDTAGRFYTVADYHDAYKSGRLTPSHVVESLLPLIRRDVADRSPHSTAFIDSKIEVVREAAEASTRRWKDGKPLGILDGVPFGAKDDLDVKGYRRYIGSTKDYTEGKEVKTSWCVAKVEEAGGIMVGKLSMHELGMGKLLSGLWSCEMLTLRRYYEQQPELGHTSEPLQFTLLHGRINGRRCLCCRGRAHPLLYRI
jgi:hypothetical protein